MLRFSLAALLLIVPFVRGADRLDFWPHWRGPNADGAAVRGNPPLEWSETKNVRWKTPLPGKGSATPIVWGDRVFVLSAVDTGEKADPADIPQLDAKYAKKTKAPTTYHRFLVLCLDRATGKVLWERTAARMVPHEGHHDSHSYAAGSPTTDGRRLFASFGSFGLFCYDFEGNQIWKRDFGRMHTRLGWGEASTPTLAGDALVVNWDGEVGSFLTVLEAATGKERWRVPRDEVTSWATPLVVEQGGRTQIIISATKRIRSYDLADGKCLWECGGMTVNVIPSPIARDGVAYCLSGYTGACGVALRLDGSGDITDTDKVVWRIKQGTPYVPSPALAGERLWFVQRNEPVLTTVDIKTGKVVIDKARLPGVPDFYASPTAAAGRVYFTGRNGTTLVLRQADTLEVLATNKLDDPIDASPVVVGRQLFLRGHSHLYCLEAR